jgi:hypothetical protein
VGNNILRNNKKVCLLLRGVTLKKGLNHCEVLLLGTLNTLYYIVIERGYRSRKRLPFYSGSPCRGGTVFANYRKHINISFC